MRNNRKQKHVSNIYNGKKEVNSLNNKSLFDKAFHFLVHNSFMVTVAIMGIVHAALLVIMLCAGVMPLVNFNILSVVVYLFCVALCKVGNIVPVYISILLEVSTYATLATFYIGWDSGSYCFICSLIPIIIYIGCFIFKQGQRWIIALSLLLDFALFAALYIIFVDATPVFELDPAVRTVLFIFAAFMAGFAIVFYYAVYIYASESDRTSLENENRQLSADAHEDALTNALNRRGFLPILEEMMKDKKAKDFCIAFCDLDNFKRINDSYGHDCGDEVLRHITKLIKSEITDCPICRWGGEEIVILMKNYELASAKEKMESVRKNIESNPTVFFNKRIYVTVTIGLAENKAEYNNSEEFIKVADERMYYGKTHGKNIVIFENVS